MGTNVHRENQSSFLFLFCLPWTFMSNLVDVFKKAKGTLSMLPVFSGVPVAHFLLFICMCYCTPCSKVFLGIIIIFQSIHPSIHPSIHLSVQQYNIRITFTFTLFSKHLQIFSCLMVYETTTMSYRSSLFLSALLIFTEVTELGLQKFHECSLECS